MPLTLADLMAGPVRRNQVQDDWNRAPSNPLYNTPPSGQWPLPPQAQVGTPGGAPGQPGYTIEKNPGWTPDMAGVLGGEPGHWGPDGQWYGVWGPNGEWLGNQHRVVPTPGGGAPSQPDPGRGTPQEPGSDPWDPYAGWINVPWGQSPDGSGWEPYDDGRRYFQDPGITKWQNRNTGQFAYSRNPDKFGSIGGPSQPGPAPLPPMQPGQVGPPAGSGWDPLRPSFTPAAPASPWQPSAGQALGGFMGHGMGQSAMTPWQRMTTLPLSQQMGAMRSSGYAPQTQITTPTSDLLTGRKPNLYGGW